MNINLFNNLKLSKYLIKQVACILLFLFIPPVIYAQTITSVPVFSFPTFADSPFRGNYYDLDSAFLNACLDKLSRKNIPHESVPREITDIIEHVNSPFIRTYPGICDLIPPAVDPDNQYGPGIDRVTIREYPPITCPTDFTNVDPALEEACNPPQPNQPPKNPVTCDKSSECCIGNPCNVSTGAKIQTDTDFSGNLLLVRNYQTLNLVDVGFGKGWRSNFQQQLSISNNELYVTEGSGRGDPWRRVNGVWESDVDSDYLLSETSSGFTVTGKRGDVMTYDLEGKLLSETDPQGRTSNYSYNTDGLLTQVTNHYQQSLSFTYSNDGKNHITKATDAQGVEYGYEYDTNDNLIAVVYPDGDSDPVNNPKRIYHYEDTNFPNHLTGITDANGNRYGTYAYDANGKAISTEHAQTTNTVGQEHFQLNYQGAN